MRTKLIVSILLLLIAIAAAVAWYEYRKADSVEPPAEEIVVPDDEPLDGDGLPPELTWDEAVAPPVEASPEGLYNDLKAASEDAHQKPSLEIERVPPPTLPPPTRSEDDDPA